MMITGSDIAIEISAKTTEISMGGLLALCPPRHATGVGVIKTLALGDPPIGNKFINQLELLFSDFIVVEILVNRFR